MPVVRVTLLKGVFSTEQKHAMAEKITDAIVEVQGSEAFRELVLVLIDELQDGYHVGGKALNPGMLKSMLRSKASEGSP